PRSRRRRRRWTHRRPRDSRTGGSSEKVVYGPGAGNVFQRIEAGGDRMTEFSETQPNSLPPDPQVPVEFLTPVVPPSEAPITPEPAVPALPRDPAWTGWDVLAIFLVGVVALFAVTF